MSQAAVMVLTYGPSGVGKTSDMIAAFPRAEFIAFPRSVRAAHNLWGYEIPEPDITPARNIREALTLVEKSLEKKKKRAIVIDDLSPMADYSVDAYRNGTDGHSKKTGYDIFQAVTSDLLHLRKLAETANAHIVMNAHVGPPHMNSLNNRWVRGGPRLPGQLPELIITAFDMILRVEADADRTVGWPNSYKCPRTETDYVYKDRHAVANLLEKTPPNLRELLVASGYTLDRPPGLEWMDQAVENMASFWLAQIAAGTVTPAGLGDKTVVGPIFSMLREKLSAKYTKVEAHQNWALRDAWDRTLIRWHLALARSGSGSIFGG